jgi:hypothetical protein
VIRVLLDTCVLSELQRPQGNPQVHARVGAFEPQHLYLSVIAFGEIIPALCFAESSGVGDGRDDLPAEDLERGELVGVGQVDDCVLDAGIG